MELTIRATDVQITPSDTSAVIVRVECADAEDVREQVLRRPDDAADDWPLAKRYGEVCDRAEKMRGLIAECLALNPAVIGDMEKVVVWANLVKHMAEAVKTP